MAAGKFGKLENVELRDGWPDEAADFTPWLAENLERLSDAIGVSLELVNQEVSVEEFRADILAHNPEDDCLVLIENQLEASDHRHLGQILTYLTGLDARIVVWVARDFREPHLSAIHWLNDHVGEPFAFFAVKVRLVQIEGSLLAPIFDVLAKPSAWDRQLRQASTRDVSEIGEFRRSFWTFYAERYPSDAETAGLRSGHALGNIWHPTGEPRILASQYIAQGGVGTYLTTPRGEPLEDVFVHLRGYEDAIRTELGTEVGASPKRHAAVMYHRTETRDRANWETMADWLHERLEGYQRVLSAGPAEQA